MTDPRKTIVVTGIGVVSPYGIGMDCLLEGMLSGKCCLSPTKDLPDLFPEWVDPEFR